MYIYVYICIYIYIYSILSYIYICNSIYNYIYSMYVWFIMEIPLQMDDLGLPLFLEPPYIPMHQPPSAFQGAE